MVKNVKINEDLHKKLFNLKLNFNLGSLDKVIEGMYKLMKNLRLMKDFEIMLQSEIKIKK